MQPQLCARCGKNPAVVFVTKFDGRESKNEGLCLKCAKQLGIKPIDDIFEKMGIAEEDLDSLQSEMTGALSELGSMLGGGLPEDMGGDDEDEEDSGKTATFPFMNRLFGGANGGNGVGSNSGAGATQTTGYKFGQGEPASGQNPGGGGGWYGGKRSNGGVNAGGGGGSGYIGGVLNGEMTAGVQQGDGKAKITVIED